MLYYVDNIFFQTVIIRRIILNTCVCNIQDLNITPYTLAIETQKARTIPQIMPQSLPSTSATKSVVKLTKNERINK
jgi:hypothetical protein